MTVKIGENNKKRALVPLCSKLPFNLMTGNSKKRLPIHL